MKEFTVGGTGIMQLAFAETLGVGVCENYVTDHSYLYGDNNDAGVVIGSEVDTFCQSDTKANVHFELPQDWNRALEYARRFYRQKETNQNIVLSPQEIADMIAPAMYSCELYEDADTPRAGCHWKAWLINQIEAYAAREFSGVEKPKEEKQPNPMEDPEFWKDKQLEAIDPCRMKDCETGALTVGNRYDPIVRKSDFSVRSNASDFHYFDWKVLEKYFKVVDKKPPLPESWNDVADESYLLMDKKNEGIYDAFAQLYDLRQAYWNHYQPGWKPDWEDGKQPKYCIKHYMGGPSMYAYFHENQFLAFPTEEQSRHFMRHHKALIEQAKDLV